MGLARRHVLLNPEGFAMRLFRSRLILFVKLRQFRPGNAARRRRHPESSPGAEPDSAVAYKALYQQAGFSDLMRLERWQAQADLGVVPMSKVPSCLSSRASLSDEAGAYSAGCWLRLPARSQHHPDPAEGALCTQ